MREMERLLEDGSAAALAGVLRRLAVNAQGHIADEEEKQWLEDALVRCGDPARAPLQAYIASGDRLTHALRAYVRIVGEAAATQEFLRVLAAYGPEDHRSGDAKLQLVLQLSESLAAEPVLEQLAPFLRDHSNEVRRAVLELIERGAAADQLSPAARAAVLPPLGHLIQAPEVTPRLARQAAELLAARQWPLPPEVAGVAAALDDAYFVDKKHLVRRRRDQSVA